MSLAACLFISLSEDEASLIYAVHLLGWLVAAHNHCVPVNGLNRLQRTSYALLISLFPTFSKCHWWPSQQHPTIRCQTCPNYQSNNDHRHLTVINTPHWALCSRPSYVPGCVRLLTLPYSLPSIPYATQPICAVLRRNLVVPALECAIRESACHKRECLASFGGGTPSLFLHLWTLIGEAGCMRSSSVH